MVCGKSGVGKGGLAFYGDQCEQAHDTIKLVDILVKSNCQMRFADFAFEASITRMRYGHRATIRR